MASRSRSSWLAACTGTRAGGSAQTGAPADPSASAVVRGNRPLSASMGGPRVQSACGAALSADLQAPSPRSGGRAALRLPSRRSEGLPLVELSVALRLQGLQRWRIRVRCFDRPTAPADGKSRYRLGLYGRQGGSKPI